MIPFGFRGFRAPPTRLYLNGPKLTFNEHPSGVIVEAGDTAVFTASAVASFNEDGDGTPDGIIEYRWYDQNGPLRNGSNISGANTTKLTISNIGAAQNRSIYLQANYIPGNFTSTRGYQTYKTSGKAVNGPLNSNTAQLKVRPIVTITSQPSSASAPDGETASFSASASINDPSYSLTYYWTLNGSVVSNSNKTTIELTKSGTSTDTVRFYAYATFE